MKATELATVEQLPTTPNPLMILEGAIARGIDADQLEKLMELQERWEANQARKAFDRAMAQFQAACPVIKKTKPVRNPNGSIRYWYAPLEVVLPTIKPHMKDAGLSIRFSTDTTGSVITAICTVSHQDGHSEVSHFTAPVDEKMHVNETQKMVSANSYAKRIAVMNALNLAASNEDDDGGSLSPPRPTAEQVAAHEQEKAKRKPQEPATDKQLIRIQDHIDALQEMALLDERQIKLLKSWTEDKDTLTKNHATYILKQIREDSQ